MYQQQQPQQVRQQQQQQQKHEETLGLIRERLQQLSKALHLQGQNSVEQQGQQQGQQQQQQHLIQVRSVEGRQQPVKGVEGRQQYGWEQQQSKWEQEGLVESVKDLLSQVQTMIMKEKPEEKQYGMEKTGEQQHQELLRQLREIQTQILSLYQGQQSVERQQVRQPRNVENVEGKQEQQQEQGKQQEKEEKKEREFESTFEIIPVEELFFGRGGRNVERQIQTRLYAQERRQLVEKLVQQVRIFEEMLFEQQYERQTGLFHAQLCKQLIQQIKTQLCEIEEHFYGFGYETIVPIETIQKQKQYLQQLKQQVEEIERLYTQQQQQQFNLQESFIQYQQQQGLVQKVREFRQLAQEIMCWTQQQQQSVEQVEQQQQYRCELTTEPFTYKLYSIPRFFDEQLSLTVQTKTQQQQGEQKPKTVEQITTLRQQLEELKLSKQELEMKLNETGKKVEECQRQIEQLEKVRPVQPEGLNTQVEQQQQQQQPQQWSVQPKSLEHRQQQQQYRITPVEQCEHIKQQIKMLLTKPEIMCQQGEKRQSEQPRQWNAQQKSFEQQPEKRFYF